MNESTLALYARVSSDRQAQEKTIESQVACLRQYADEHDFEVCEDLIFSDEGISGTSLDRPGLDRLRDRAATGEIDQILILSPDRLARKYSHQLILVDEFQRLGVEINFVNRKISDSPEDQLLFQIQGVIAEFERDKFIERSRRGRLHRARSGHISVCSHAPYGYVYLSKKLHGEASYEINPGEAAVVQRIYREFTEEWKSLHSITKGLNDDGIPTKKKRARWAKSSIWQMLKNPAYTGRAAFQKAKSIPRARLRPIGGKKSYRAKSSRIVRPKEDWIYIPVPQIIEAEAFERAQMRLAENQKKAKRNKKYKYLVGAMVRCKICNGAFSGISSVNRGNKAVLRYYRCANTVPALHGGIRRCSSRSMRAEVLDDLVWQQTKLLIRDPKTLYEQYVERLRGMKNTEVEIKKVITEKEKLIAKKNTEKSRILDLYQTDTITKADVSERLNIIRLQIKTLEGEIHAVSETLRKSNHQLKMVEQFGEFSEAIGTNLEGLDFEKRRQLVQLLVEEVLVDTCSHEVEVRHILNSNPELVLRPNRVSIAPAGGRRQA